MFKRLSNSDLAWAYECYCSGVSWSWISRELGVPSRALQWQVHYAIKNGLKSE